MERLKIVLAVAAFLATAHTSPGQQFPVAAPGHPASVPTQPSYVVIGDVQNFNYFPLSGKTTVRQAVLQAGLLSDSVSVSVVRASQDRALWTQMISSESADSGEFVLNGDLLVVQSLVPVAVPVQRNAALRTDAGVFIVALADEPIAAGDVLLQTNNRPTPEQRLTISCRFRGRSPLARATPADEVAHGDVLTLSRANPSGLKGFGSLVPAWSEWRESASTTALPPGVPSADQSQFDPVRERSDTNFPGSLTPMPALSEETEDHSVGMVIPQPDPFVDATFVNTAEVDIDTPLNMRLVAQTSQTSESDGPIVAPHPPTEYPELADSVEMASASAQMSPWNLIFIVGLLVAGTLILAASLRAEEASGSIELPAKVLLSEQIVAQPAADEAITLSHAERTIETAPPVAPTEAPITPMAVRFSDIVSVTSEASPQETARTNVTPSSLVSMNEWYSKDWLSTVPNPSAVDDISNLPNREHVSAVNLIEELRAEQGPATSMSEPSQERKHSAEPPTIKNLTDIPEHSSDVPMNGFTELEDLLRNRLPIDLCTTRLPLRIALYGRPAGPRRLRIDSAHHTLAAPHMIQSAERKRAKAGLTSDSTSESGDHDSRVADSLNRALDHLQEQTDHDLRD